MQTEDIFNETEPIQTKKGVLDYNTGIYLEYEEILRRKIFIYQYTELWKYIKSIS